MRLGPMTTRQMILMMNHNMNTISNANRYGSLYKYGCEKLQAAGVPEADLDARLLLELVCNTDRNTLLVHPEREVSEEEYSKYCALLAKRSDRIPLQHLTGEQVFMGLSFVVNEHVLIPRQDTEILVEEAMKYLHDGMRILDMCTGSGCILLSLLHYSNDCTGLGVDLSKQALSVAEENAKRLGMEEKTKFVHSDLFTEVDGKYDLIVSNPPYIASEEVEKLMPEVKEHEPRMALDGSDDGLLFYRKIVAESIEYLQPGGYLLFEIGYDQGVAVSKLMTDAGYKEVEVIKDYAGLDRVVCGYRGIL